MRHEYKIENGSVIEIITRIDLEDIKRELEDKDKKYGRFSPLDEAVRQIADEAAKQFIIKHMGEVLKLMKPEEIANLASLKVLDRIYDRGNS